MRSVFILCSLIPCLVFSNSYDSIRSERRDEGLFVIHEVEEDETLYSIARRYKSSVPSIVAHNKIENNRIDIGQQLEVIYGLIWQEKKEPGVEVVEAGYHKVQKGETLYSISKQYGMKVRQLRKLNELESNDISLGQRLKVTTEIEESDTMVAKDTKPITNEPILSVKEDTSQFSDLLDQLESIDFESYWVQTGETLASIAEKVDVSVEQLMDWNELTSTFLKIGQELKFVKEEELPAKVGVSKESGIDKDGFKRIYEEGIAAEINDIKTTKFLALHRSLPIGSELAVRNLMNDLVVHVKVVGRLPDTGLNENIMLRLSSPAYNQLGILDPKSRVEVSYYK